LSCNRRPASRYLVTSTKPALLWPTKGSTRSRPDPMGTALLPASSGHRVAGLSRPPGRCSAGRRHTRTASGSTFRGVYTANVRTPVRPLHICANAPLAELASPSNERPPTERISSRPPRTRLAARPTFTAGRRREPGTRRWAHLWAAHRAPSWSTGRSGHRAVLYAGLWVEEGGST
jgi:hypothetical protein